MGCYLADFRLYSMVYSLLNSPWVVKKAFFWAVFWLYTTYAATGLVTSATASIMAGSRLVRWEVCGAMPGLPGLTPHAYILIDSNRDWS